MPLDFYCPDFSDGEDIPEKYTCDGESVSPMLHITGVPDDAESLVLIVDDLDNDDFLHWLVWNISPSCEFIMEGETPEDAFEGFNDFGEAEFGAICPPRGQKHRYQFKLYALDTTLDLEEDVTRGQVEREMAGHILDDVTFTGVCKR